MQDSRDLYLRLLGHVRPHWKGFVLTLAATVLATASEPLFPALVKPLLDKGFGQGSTAWPAWLQVHGELVLEVPKTELEPARKALPKLLGGVAKLKVALLVEVGVGANWDTAD